MPLNGMERGRKDVHSGTLCRDTTRGDGGRAEPPGGGEAIWRPSEHDREDAPVFDSARLSAARAAGVKVYKNLQNSDVYFSRSDNQSLADLGIPAHTLSVAFDFPDYHKVSDSWDKIDYDNMAAVDRAVALGMLRLASDAPPPKWNAQYAPARRYVEAGRRLHP